MTASALQKNPANIAVSDDGKTSYSISDLAAEFDVTPRTIRFYEDKGLIKPDRKGMNRVYRRGHRMRLEMILRGKRLGFSLSEIQEILDIYRRPGGPEEQLRLTLKKSRQRITSLQRQRQDIDEMLAELDTVCGELETWLQDKKPA